VRVVSSTAEALTPTSIALGNFDGVHRGHQRVIQPAVTFAHQSASVLARGDRPAVSPLLPEICPTVVTFDPHPREFFSGNPKRLLTPLPEKVQELEKLGVEQLVLMPFDRELAALTPEEFVGEILVKQLQIQSISIGMDFCFGRQRSGNSTDLQAIAVAHGVEVTIAPLHKENNERISSSAIRAALAAGQIDYANQLLGRPYKLQGCVVHGEKIGRKIGFPTANIELSSNKFLPKYGVYGVQVSGGKLNQVQWGILNIGCRPTVNPNAVNPTIEVHLFNYDDDLYGENLSLELWHYLRPEQKFESLQHLQTQIHRDCDRTKQLFNLI
jgi:riboflavin kinase / FMN adenylyltransferase